MWKEIIFFLSLRAVMGMQLQNNSCRMSYNQENQLAKYESSTNRSSTGWQEAKQEKINRFPDFLSLRRMSQEIQLKTRFHFQKQRRCKLPRSIPQQKLWKLFKMKTLSKGTLGRWKDRKTQYEKQINYPQINIYPFVIISFPRGF